MKKILITGGAGFIGSHVTLALQEKYPDAFIIVVDNLNARSFDAKQGGGWRNLQGFKGDLLVRDVSDKDWVNILGQSTFDCVLHFAAQTDTRETEEYVAFENIEGFRGSMTIARRNKCPLVYASSAAVYGVREGEMKESDPLTPANIYGFSKVQNDNMATIMSRVEPTWPVMGLRFFNVYGPGESHKNEYNSMVYQLYRGLLDSTPTLFKSGEQKRDFIYVKDVVSLVLKCLEKPKAGIYNCGSGEARSFNELFDIIQKVVGLDKKVEPRYIDCPYRFFQTFTQADISLAKKTFDWTPAYTLEQGVAEYIKILKLSKKH